MRNLPAVGVLLCLVSAPLSLSARQNHQTPSHQHAASVMGFDQDRTTHHFLLFPDGGAIDVAVTDVADAKNRDAIRSHLSHIAMMFAGGDFTAPMLVHDSSSVPGTKIMAERKAAIRFQYVETPSGGRVNIVTTDATALAGLHEFLRYQIAEHKTGDPTAVRTR